ncbi:MAG: cytotoxin [Bacilli bacterium]
MNIQRKKKFDKKLHRLAKEKPIMLDQVEKTLDAFLRYPPAHPSLRMKHIQGTDGLFECSDNMDIRITFEFAAPDTILLRNIDRHVDALKQP